ncbi:MAG: class III cytochrome C family protein [Bacteroidetes bacterium]|nr:class III cytochrome C family protein [Bacteroidota bacterium]
MKKLLVIGILLLFAFLMVMFPHVMVNPGELSSGHQKLSNKCTSCHEPFRSIPNAKCVACHKLEDIGRDTLSVINPDSSGRSTPFHVALKDQSCIECHTDHKGEKVRMSQFDHMLLPPAIINTCEKCHNKPTDKLHGRLSTSCTNCHSTKGWKTGVVFNHSMIQGDNSKCTECHQKPTDTFHAQLNDNCGKCHSMEKWKPATFEHSGYFLLDKDHNVECRICHSTPDFGKYTCYGCHEHTPSKLANEHNEEGIYNFDNCVSCHKSANKHDIRGHGEGGRESGGESEGKEHDND